jgi:hypothetical protein
MTVSAVHWKKMNNGLLLNLCQLAQVFKATDSNSARSARSEKCTRNVVGRCERKMSY